MTQPKIPVSVTLSICPCMISPVSLIAVGEIVGDGVDLRVDDVDPAVVGLDDFEGGDTLCADRFGEGAAQLAQWLRDGELQSREDVVQGDVAQFPDVLLRLFRGENTGKLVLALESA